MDSLLAFSNSDGANVPAEHGSRSTESETAAVTGGELARLHGISRRTIRFYQSKGLLRPLQSGKHHVFSRNDSQRLALILQGKRLGFTLFEIREMMAAWRPSRGDRLPMSRRQCVEQIRLLERQRCEAEEALRELRAIYTEMFQPTGTSAALPSGKDI